MNSGGGGLRAGGGVAKRDGGGTNDITGGNPTEGGSESNGCKKDVEDAQRGEYRCEETVEVKVTELSRK